MTQSFWRNHGKPYPVRLKRRGVPVPEAGSLAETRALLKQLEQATPAGGGQRPRFGFAAAEVAEIYTHKEGEGAGVWFRLKSGQIINRHGEPEGTDTAPFAC